MHRTVGGDDKAPYSRHVSSHRIPQFQTATPVLPAHDYARSRTFYRDQLGFRVVEEAGSPLAFGIFERGLARVFVDAFRGVPRSNGEDHGWQAYFRVDGVDLLFDEFQSRGVTGVGPVQDTNYGMREFEVLDPDSNRICFGEDVSPRLQIARNHYVLAVHDLARTRDWYTRVLGCTSEDVDPGNWVFLKTDSVTFMAGHCPDALAPSELGDHSYFAYLVVDRVDDWAERAQKAGASFIKPLTTEPWGMREFGVRTVDGHRIMLGQSTTPD